MFNILLKIIIFLALKIVLHKHILEKWKVSAQMKTIPKKKQILSNQFCIEPQVLLPNAARLP